MSKAATALEKARVWSAEKKKRKAEASNDIAAAMRAKKAKLAKKPAGSSCSRSSAASRKRPHDDENQPPGRRSCLYVVCDPTAVTDPNRWYTTECYPSQLAYCLLSSPGAVYVLYTVARVRAKKKSTIYLGVSDADLYISSIFLQISLKISESILLSPHPTPIKGCKKFSGGSKVISSSPPEALTDLNRLGRSGLLSVSR